MIRWLFCCIGAEWRMVNHVAHSPFSIFNPQLLFRRRNCHLHDPVAALLKQIVRRFDLIQWENMRDERCGINLAFRNQPEDLGTVAAVYPARLEGEVLAVHVG